MRRLRVLSILLFLAACVCFGGYKFYYEGLLDNTAPVITVPEGSLSVSVTATEEELLEGITAEDGRDGDVTDSLFVESLSNFTAEATRTMYVIAVDGSGNVARASREVVYSDYEAPKFTLTEPLAFPVGEDDLLSAMGASDQLDGDLSDRVKVTGTYTLDDVAGNYPMEFTVSNSAGDVSKITATVELYELSGHASQPEIVLSDYLVYTDSAHKLDAWSYVQSITLSGREYSRSGNALTCSKTANPNYPEAIGKSSVKITDEVDYATPGCYEITYRYTWNDYSGSVRLVVVVE